MARKTEQRLWDTFKRRTPLGWWARRVENLASEGDPDVELILPGGAVRFVELKATARVPVRAATPLLGKTGGLRPSQVAWHVKASAMCARSYVLIRAGEHVVVLIEGRHATEINASSLTRLRELAAAEGWQAIFLELERQ